MLKFATVLVMLLFGHLMAVISDDLSDEFVEEILKIEDVQNDRETCFEVVHPPKYYDEIPKTKLIYAEKINKEAGIRKVVVKGGIMCSEKIERIFTANRASPLFVDQYKCLGCRMNTNTNGVARNYTAKHYFHIPCTTCSTCYGKCKGNCYKMCSIDVLAGCEIVTK
ncbi:uncharacterized protein LOC123012445 [Tribolium madens]|uniref:uncharacterized protein LOC123012445 n=1 Tax=Tribolium madens TaxID=41895 RepID=UPI001CF742EF|nr:uncharacterized protein LOC123012445 [Tribolium madens]